MSAIKCYCFFFHSTSKVLNIVHVIFICMAVAEIFTFHQTQHKVCPQQKVWEPKAIAKIHTRQCCVNSLQPCGRLDKEAEGSRIA